MSKKILTRFQHQINRVYSALAKNTRKITKRMDNLEERISKLERKG